MEKTLLLVDDEVSVLKALTRLFRRAGYTVYTAEGGVEAMMLLADHDIAVVLSDFRMPGMTGDELLREVKKRYPDTVRMILSGFADMDTVMNSLNDGAIFKFLVKPWENDFLLKQLEEAFAHWQDQQDQKALSRLALGAEEALFDVDREGRVVHLTEAAAQHCGWSAEDARGEAITRLLPAMTDLERVLLLHPDGSRISLRNVQGRPVELSSTRTDSNHWTLRLSTRVSQEAESVYAMGIEGLLDESGLKSGLSQLMQLDNNPVFSLIYLNISGYQQLTGQLSARELDELLYQVAQMLMLWRHNGGAVAWLGQDEFVLLERAVRADAEIRRRITEQLAPFNAPIIIDQHSLPISFNAGYAVYPDDAADVATLCNHARLALKHSRRREGQYFPRFQHRMALDTSIQNELVDDLYYAMERNELVVCYQPEIHLLDGSVTGVHASIGWRHEQFGLIGAEQLYPIIVQCDLAETLLEWLQAMAAAQTELWSIDGLPALNVTTGLEPEQSHADLLECLQRCQSVVEMPASGWALRLSEAFLLMDIEDSLQVLPKIQVAGWHLICDSLCGDTLLHSTTRHGEQQARNAHLLARDISREDITRLNDCVVQHTEDAPEHLSLEPLTRQSLSVSQHRRLSFVGTAITADRLRLLIERKPLVTVSIVLSAEEELD
ncbi:MAG: response regulator [Marinobacterium sp.]|nr:response regulator [Marinobacterium sp.]